MKTRIFKTKLGIITLLIMTAIVCIIFVGFNAYSAKLQFDINKINSEISDNQFEIAKLQVKIQSATNVNNLETRALEMGLIYPDFGDMIILNSSENQVVDLAMALKQNAYE